MYSRITTNISEGMGGGGGSLDPPLRDKVGSQVKPCWKSISYLQEVISGHYFPISKIR